MSIMQACVVFCFVNVTCDFFLDAENVFTLMMHLCSDSRFFGQSDVSAGSEA